MWSTVVSQYSIGTLNFIGTKRWLSPATKETLATYPFSKQTRWATVGPTLSIIGQLWHNVC